MSLRPLRFGILGAAKIAPLALIAPAARTPGASVVAVASRDRSRAEAFSSEQGIPIVVDSYEELVSHPQIDCVYNALPPSGHAPWTIRALEAGEHVLCEKPFCLSAREAREMVSVAARAERVLCEAFHDRYHPLAARILEIVRSGQLGELREIEGRFTVPILDQSDLRYQLELGGGATMDLGCYPIHQALMVVGESPEVVSAVAREGPAGIDIEMKAELRFPSGVVGRIHCGMYEGIPVDLSLKIVGSSGELFVRNPIHPYAGHELQLARDGRSERFQVDGDTTYKHQLDAFCDAVRHGAALPTGGRDAIETMRVIDAIYSTSGLPPRAESSH